MNKYIRHFSILGLFGLCRLHIMWIQEVAPERQRREAPGENAVELELNKGSHDVEELVHFLPILLHCQNC